MTMPKFFLLLITFTFSLALFAQPGNTTIKLPQLETAKVVESSRAGQIGLTNTQGKQRYAQYTEIDLVQIGFVPAATGNTSNYSEFVTASDSSIWYIDWQGRGIRLQPAPVLDRNGYYGGNLGNGGDGTIPSMTRSTITNQFTFYRATDNVGGSVPVRVQVDTGNESDFFSLRQGTDSLLFKREDQDFAINSTKNLVLRAADLVALIGDSIQIENIPNNITGEKTFLTYSSAKAFTKQEGIDTEDLNFTPLTTATSAGGDLTGTYPNPTVAPNAIGSSEITDATIAAADLAQMGASSGQVLKWNGTAWAPSADDGSTPAGATNNTLRYSSANTLAASTNFLNNETEVAIATSIETGTKLKVGGFTSIVGSLEAEGAGTPNATPAAAAIRLSNTSSATTWYLGNNNTGQLRSYSDGLLWEIMKGNTGERLYFGSTTIGQATKSLDARFAVSDSTASETLALFENKQGSSTSNATVSIRVPSAGGDPSTVWSNGSQSYAAGLDNSNGDYWVLSGSATLGTSDILRAGNGKIGIGATNPSNGASLTIGAGTATVAPLLFTGGTNLTTPANGAIEYDGTNYFATSGGTRHTLAKTLTNTASLNYPSTAAGDYNDLTITVTGAAVGDAVVLGIANASISANPIHWMGWVSAANTVTIRFLNLSSAAVDPGAGTFRASVLKY